MAPGPRDGLFSRRSAEPWRDDSPIRSDQFSAEMFERHAVSLADSQVVVADSRPVVSLLRRLEENSRALVGDYETVMRAVADGRPIAPAAEWLVDNFHILEENIRQVRQDLPRGYFRQLPKLGAGAFEGHPRIFGIMWAYVAHTDSSFDPDELGHYIRAYETRKALTLGELWAVAINLRILLIENARRVADQVVTATELRNTADDVADRILGIDGAPPEPLARALPTAGFQPSHTFTLHLLRRLTEQSADEARAWLQAHLEGVDVDEAIQQEHRDQARDSLTMRNIFRSFRLIADVSWEDWLESVSLIERELRVDPGYVAQDFTTRNLYRTAVERLARGSGQDEIDVTRRALTLARNAPDDLGRHIGFWLVDDGLAHLERSLGYRSPLRERAVRGIRRAGLPGYAAAVTVLTAAVVGATLWLVTWLAGGLPTAAIVALGLVAAIPASEFALGTVNRRLTHVLHATLLPALELPDGVPEEYRTLVVVPTMLTSADGVEELLEGLEVHFLGNDSGEVYFAAVTDWADSPTENAADDEPLLRAAVEGIRHLNERHGYRFLLFHRSRRHNPAEGVWMGWERKRGKLEELNDLLQGARETSFTTVEGRVPGPFRYVITLDSDTLLPRTAAKMLVGKMAHPLNRARIHPGTGRITRGYSILAPRVTPSLPPREETSAFQSVYSTQRGLDPYAFTVSDVYQDLFQQGSFAGKGIYDVGALTRALRDRIPENAVLSHDLLEGNYARAGLASDIEVVEDHPTSYEVGASRSHRWTRGDWQLLPWILRRHDGLDALGIWKMLDNLRRSLVPIAQVLGLLLAVALLPAPAALAWLALVVASFLLPPMFPLVPSLLLRRRGITRRSRLQALGHDAGKALALGVLNLTFLGHQAAVMVDAISRTLFRLVVSRRRLLEWTTAAAAQAQARGTIRRFVQVMAGGFVAPVALLAVAALRGPAHAAIAALPAVLWLLAPLVAQRISRLHRPIELAVTPEELGQLRLTARRTWSFFETFVTAEENHLPPDNYQEDPAPRVAHRTSPTNIGLYLLTTIAARDLGWIGLAEAADRLERTLETVARLEHHRGHLLNWYDTLTLEPLAPRYVSSVDSGNLAGHLLVVAAACRQWAEDPDLDADSSTGLADGLALVRQALGDPPPARDPLAGVADAVAVLGRQRDDGALAAVEDALAGAAPHVPGDEARAWVEATVRSTRSLRRDASLSALDREALRERLTRVAEQAQAEFAATDFQPLLDPRRELLSVGLAVDERRLDESCYDLLASECRLASFVAIAKADVRTRHWFRLGRGVTAAGGGAALLSWSGSMFEYLMPPLVMRTPEAGLLSSTQRRVVRRQIAYGAERGVPWGISESGYNARDREQNYQYSPFGVPGLGIVRGLADNLVVAPYATGLAAMVAPDAAARNYERLAALGARGPHGFYEAVDFTRSRLRPDQEFAVVRSYMAHHQGMTVVAIHNVLTDGLMRERFHAAPIVRATELLLQERAPRHVPVTHARSEDREPARVVRAVVPPAERALTGTAALAPGLHLLSNGHLSLRTTPAGGGQLRWRGLAITRWQPDLTTPVTGDYVYLREDRTGHVWSATAEPCGTWPDAYDVHLADDRVRHVRTDRSLRTTVEQRISPEANALLRSVSVDNSSHHTRRLTLTSYAELVLADSRDDDAHPAFSKLFVHTEFLPGPGAVVATRRRRSPDAPEAWVAHFVVEGDAPDGGGAVGDPVPETDRAAFLGRNRTTLSPQRLDAGGGPTGTTGHVLDPIMSLRQEIEIPPESRVTVHLWTVVAPTRAEVLRLVDQHRASGAAERVTSLAWTQSQIELRDLRVTPDEATHFQRLAGHLLFPDPAMRASAARLLEAAPQSALWPLGISGDLPLLVVRIDDAADLDVARQAVRAFEFWRTKRFAVDVVLLDEQPASYTQGLQRELESLVGTIRARTGHPDSTGRLHVVRRDHADHGAIAALLGAAAVVLVARRGPIAKQLTAPHRMSPPPQLPPPAAPPEAAGGTRTADLVLANGIGGFSADGREYVVVLDGGASTPGPWTNVVANGQFGFHATAEGAGCTWWRNSRDNLLTPWRNDPVSTPVSEALYVRDEETGRVTTAPASPAGNGGRHTVRHGFGYTRYVHESDGIELDQLLLVPPEDPVKLTVLRLTNRTGRRRELTVTAYAELVLGQDRGVTSRHVITESDPLTRALLARNPWSVEYPDQVAFLDMAGTQESWTGDRREFLGLHGTTRRPRAVTSAAPLSDVVGAGMDPCAALQRRVVLGPGETAQVLVTLGAGHDLAEVRRLVDRYRREDPFRVLEEVRATWERRLGTVQVSTPSPAFDVMVNGWLLYQTLACRMLARSGYHQASGAFGFRDQLQDSMAVALVEPDVAREHLLRAAGRQFVEGDVQHWWLPATGRGIRTRISDDVVWLAHAACHHVRVTGDATVLDEQVPFLDGPVLDEDQDEAFFLPEVSPRTASVYDHCVLALTHAFRYGRHGLPLMGTGDWNDGMNRVGVGGDGESVWLGWFLHATLSDFAALAERRGDDAVARRCRQEQDTLLAALEEHGWDGDWYRRGYFDDGTPLGSATRPECRIDAIAQSWAVLAGAGDPERAARAMDQVDEQLVMREEGVARLFTPPFDSSEPDPGYIRAYPPGVRENGGQYTHGALWSVFAWAALGREDRAGPLFELINPVNHARTREAAATYGAEPYVVAADVYSVAPHVGRAGWTWYTGSAGWMYRAGLEAILGLRREGAHLRIEPCLPPEWPGADLRYRFGGTTWDIAVAADCAAPRRVRRVVVDGVARPDALVALVDDGAVHQVEVEMETRPDDAG